MFRVVMVVVMLLVTVPAGSQESQDGVDSQIMALDSELSARPESEMIDIYKFLYQGRFGPGHAIPNRTAAADDLTEELADLGPIENSDALCQALGGSPALVRIHLRPFVAGGHDPDVLVDAFVASADEVQGDPELLARTLEKAVARLIRRSQFQLAGQLEDLAKRLAAEGYPPAHHSDQYKAEYHPAYRVVLRELAEQHGWCDPTP